MNRHRAVLAIIGLLSLCGTIPVVAQIGAGPRVGLSQVASPLDVRWERSFANDSVAPNQWARGALIGGGIGAGLGLIAYYIETRLRDNGADGGVVLGTALVGALIGGLIGSFSRRT